MALDTKEGCYAEGVAAFEQVGVRIQKAGTWADKLIPIFTAANALPEPMMGALQTGKMNAKVRALKGFLAQAEVLKWELHREATDIAIASGVEVGVLGGSPR